MLEASEETETASKTKRLGRRSKARERLAAAGVAVDDVDRPKEGRQRKPRSVPLVGLRDGPGLPLRNVGHEDAARHIAGGMPVTAAWRAAGYGDTGGATWKLVHEPDFVARIAELRAVFNQGPTLSVPYLQERLAALTMGDISDFIEKVPYTTSRYRVKDPASLPPELRKAIAEWTLDKDGRLNVRLHDKAKLFDALIRTLQPSAEVNVSIGLAARLDEAMRRTATIDVTPSPARLSHPAPPLAPAQTSSSGPTRRPMEV